MIERYSDAGLDITALLRGPVRELHVTGRPLAGESPGAVMKRVAAVLRRHGATVIKQDGFGALAARAEVLDAAAREFGRIDWPVTWMEGLPCNGGSIAGVQLIAVAGVPVETVSVAGRPVGRTYTDGDVRHALFGDLGPPEAGGPRDRQAARTFDALDAALRSAGMDWSHVARTWFFLDDILAWYGPFNTVRTDFYRRHLPDSFLPASTGVGAKNAAGKALEAAAWAARRPDGAAAAREIPSPQQCPAPRYGSSFSRAVRLDGPGYRRLLVSGTASIAPGGETAREGDPAGQIDLTMGVIQAILESSGFDFSHVSRTLMYFKHGKDYAAFEAWRASKGHAWFPGVTLQSTLCRDDLLFEIEMDALAPAV